MYGPVHLTNPPHTNLAACRTVVRSPCVHVTGTKAGCMRARKALPPRPRTRETKSVAFNVLEKASSPARGFPPPSEPCCRLSTGYQYACQTRIGAHLSVAFNCHSQRDRGSHTDGDHGIERTPEAVGNAVRTTTPQASTSTQAASRMLVKVVGRWGPGIEAIVLCAQCVYLAWHKYIRLKVLSARYEIREPSFNPHSIVEQQCASKVAKNSIFPPSKLFLHLMK